MARLQELPRRRASTWLARSGRALPVAILSLAYFSYVFRLNHTDPWTMGLGDWHDPYFINALLEHWYRSLTELSSPASPPIYFPARGTLGYSHGLILFAPFYIPLRLLFHPFQAYTFALLAVIVTGTACLYVFARKLGLSVIEAFIATAFFVSSRNVMHGETGVWSQRASVFLIPPVLLLMLSSWRMPASRGRALLAACAGAFATLMYAQDFYTAHFAVLFAAPCVVVFACGRADVRARFAEAWASQSRVPRLALVVTGLAIAWTGVVFLTGGGELALAGARIRSHDWTRPAMIAVLALASFVALGGRVRLGFATAETRSWVLPFVAGAVVGATIFLWIYLGAYREHRSFPTQDLLDALVPLDPGRWRTPIEVMRDLTPYRAVRSFVAVVVVGTLVWIPQFGVDRRLRRYCAWLMVVSFVVLIVPISVGGVSVWQSLVQPLPGFRVIRDPRRIIQVYELVMAVALVALLSQLPRRSVLRIATVLLMFILLVGAPNPERFDYERTVASYERWVAAPIEVAAGCTSFYVKKASDAYASRSVDAWSLYANDAMFVSLNHGLPTLNGYSAWFPSGWDLQDPHDPEYTGRVRRWADAHHLTGVCELDLDARTMTRRFQ